jgi:predicted nucleotidyltransferase
MKPPSPSDPPQPKFGLSTDALEGVLDVLRRSPRIHRVRLFGSRALGTFREGSDVDLAIEGAGLSLGDLLALHVRLDELNLPYGFDLVDVATVTNPALASHIERFGITLLG